MHGAKKITIKILFLNKLFKDLHEAILLKALLQLLTTSNNIPRQTQGTFSL